MAAPRARMLRLLSLLQTGRPWPADELAAAMDTTSRTLRRDIDHLRTMGYPVRSARGPGGNYRLVAGSALPPLMLEDDEATATVLGLRLVSAGGAGLEFSAESAERAAAKLRRLLPAPLRRRTDEVLAAVEVAGAEHPLPSPEAVSLLAAAITAREGVTFTYAGKEGTSHRRVEPARLVRLRQRWYLVAWDSDRDDWRTFRLDRVDDPRPTGETHPARDLPADDLTRYLRERFRGPETIEVVLTLRTDARDAATRLHRVDGALEPVTEHECRYVAHVDSYAWLATVLVHSDVEFTVERPAEFADYLAGVAQRLLRGTGRGSDVGVTESGSGSD
ncbi:YafY family transcriptional regulator [Spiractinospora alimapuensis]|uniref:helix-turn-helix transcriptional regulator n=1 Tax=Spiractinospora alimapuensis TaxID=2820884 RepID=UPI001F3A2720|nr:YafY family protein [Spiractinospora alimapuensis]QVQ54149.1 YafY family transcriptional regulator [Spiractinospora alimapuensis]